MSPEVPSFGAVDAIGSAAFAVLIVPDEAYAVLAGDGTLWDVRL